MTVGDRPLRALIVAYDFPPHAAIGTMRTLRVVQQLARERWDVTVLTSDPRRYRPGTPIDEALLPRVPAGVRVIRAGTFRGFDRLKSLAKGRQPVGNSPSTQAAPGAGRRRRGPLAQAVDLADAALAIPDHESGWLIPAVARGFAAVRRHRPDVLYSSAPPWTGQLVASALSRLLGCRWVADFRDPWSRAPWRGDRFRFAMKAAAVLERSIVGQADHVLFVAEGNRDDFAAHYPGKTSSKFRVIANGCDPAEFDTLGHPSPGRDGRFVLLHAGSLYAGRTPLPLFNALAAAIRSGSIDPRRFCVRFLGTSALPDLLGTCRELGLQGVVEFVPRVPREESLREMMSASALLLLQPGHTVSVPGKLYEYLAAGRPILAIAEEGETADLVRGSGLGISVTTADERAIVAAIEAVMRLAAADIPRPPRELYDGALKAAQTVEILTAVVRGEALPSTEASAPALIEREVTR